MLCFPESSELSRSLRRGAIGRPAVKYCAFQKPWANSAQAYYMTTSNIAAFQCERWDSLLLTIILRSFSKSIHTPSGCALILRDSPTA